MRVGSTFTGVGGADLGFEAAGMTISWQCELDAWKRSVLAAHWPDIPIYKDVVELADHVANSGNRLPSEILHKGQQNRRRSDNTPDTDSAIAQRGFGDVASIDVLIGGFPCQDLSIAGQRKGFSGERSVLAFEFLRIAESLKPRWLVLENVPGLLSSNKGLDFQRLLREVAACGYGVGYRCLDARYFGVPQRRRRIFIVARRAEAGIDSRTASGLALRALCESGSGDLTSCIPPWQDASRSVEDRVGESGGFRSTASFGQWVEDDMAGTLSRRDHKSPNQIISFYPTGGSHNFTREDGVSPTLKRGSGVGAESGTAIAYRKSARVNADPDSPETWVDDGRANTLNRFDVGDVRTTHAVVANAYSIREDAKANTFSATEVDAARCLQKQQPSVQSHHAQTFIAETASTLQGSSKGLRGFRNDAEGAADGHLVSLSPTLTKYNMDSRSPQSEEQQRIIDAVHSNTSVVRRLCPTECEALMGWPRNWTAPEGVKASDSRRYAACGDGIVANVAFWIGQRIMQIDKETHA